MCIRDRPNALALFSVIVASVALVVKEEVPATVNTPLSTMWPVVAVAARFRTVDAKKVNPASFTTVASPDPWVVS